MVLDNPVKCCAHPNSNEKATMEPVQDILNAFYPTETQPCKAGPTVVSFDNEIKIMQL